jgi:hypothetical protein
MTFKRIILGVFGQSFNNTRAKTDSLGYAQFSVIIEREHNEFYLNSSSMEMIEYVVNDSEEIIFALDHIRIPLSIESFTCRELKLILRNEEYLNKTRFFINLEEVDKNKVKETYK